MLKLLVLYLLALFYFGATKPVDACEAIGIPENCYETLSDDLPDDEEYIKENQ